MANTETVDLIDEKAALMRRAVIEMGYAAGGRGAHFGRAVKHRNRGQLVLRGHAS